MNTFLIFATLLATVTCRHVANTTVYVPTREQLEAIFGGETQTKSETVAVPSLVANESIIKEKIVKPYQKDNNAIRECGPNTVQLNINIKVDCDKKGPDKGEEQGAPGVHPRIVEDLSMTGDRNAIKADDCPVGKTKLNEVCVTQDV